MEYYIVNEIDRPCERLVTVERDGLLYYIHPDLVHHKGGMSKEQATRVEDFGITVRESGRCAFFTQTKKSRVLYSEGGVREWQGSESFIIIVHGLDKPVVQVDPEPRFYLQTLTDNPLLALRLLTMLRQVIPVVSGIGNQKLLRNELIELTVELDRKASNLHKEELATHGHSAQVITAA